MDFVDLSKLPEDLAKEHGLDFFVRTWLESKMAQHHPIAFNMPLDIVDVQLAVQILRGVGQAKIVSAELALLQQVVYVC